MRISRSYVLAFAGVLLASAATYFLLRSSQKPGNDSVAALQEDFRIRNASAGDVSVEEILLERDRIAKAALPKLRAKGLAAGDETALADAFAGMVTAYRLPTADHFIEFYATRGTPLDASRAEQRRRGWEKANVMADRRRV